MLFVGCVMLALAPGSLPAANSLQSIDSLTNSMNAGSADVVLLRGVVTLVRRRIVYVQDQTGAIAVFPSEQAQLAIGDEVELRGAYQRNGASGAIYNAKIRKLWSGSAPVPVSLKPAQAAEGSFAGRLIDTEGKLLHKSLSGEYLRLTMEGDGQIFAATLELSSPLSGSTDLENRLEEGSVVRLVGTCATSAEFDKTAGNAFVVLLRSSDDIRVVSPAPWWSVTHAVWTGCAALMLISLIYWMRHRSLNKRFEAIVEERSRIAREMHDTLAQGFSGLSYQLEGLAHQVNASATQDSIDEHLKLALQLVRHCREEAHRSIFALRSLTQSDPDLLALLLNSCEAARVGAHAIIRGGVEGRPAPLADEVLNHLLRIGQEAITNALRYSRASEVAVSIRFEPGFVTLTVGDAGVGFDVAAAPSIQAGHFGIAGMKERARHIRAELNIESAPGLGTRISVRAATRPNRTFLQKRADDARNVLLSQTRPTGTAG